MKVLLGPAGAGKTTLANSWLKGADVPLVARASTNPGQLAAALLSSAGLGTPADTDHDAGPLLQVFLGHQSARGRSVRAVVDDCQALSEESWALLVDSFLPDETTHAGEGPRVILVGRPPAGRLVLSYLSGCGLNLPIHGMALPDSEELARYMSALLEEVSSDSVLMTDAAIRLIARAADGQFRAMNHLCRQTTLRTLALGEDRANVAIARDVVAASHPEPGVPGDRARISANDLAIVTYEGQLIGRYPLTGKTLIGRSSLNDIVLESAYLSRHHAAFFPTEGGWRVADLNSANGLRVNGRECRLGDLDDGHLVEIGPFRIKMSLDERRQSDAAPQPGDIGETQAMPKLDPSDPAALRRVK